MADVPYWLLALPKISTLRINVTKPKQQSISEAGADLLARTAGQTFATILADPPWQFQNRTGKMAPEHKRLNRYGTMFLNDILALPVDQLTADTAHLYLWVPNALYQRVCEF
ncbi:MAG: MT-A70 family methyltransferase [Gallionella sp.]